MKSWEKFLVQSVVHSGFALLEQYMTSSTSNSQNPYTIPPAYASSTKKSVEPLRNVIDLEPVQEGTSIVYKHRKTPPPIDPVSRRSADDSDRPNGDR